MVRNQTDPKKIAKEDPLRYYQNQPTKKKGDSKAVMNALADTVFFN